MTRVNIKAEEVGDFAAAKRLAHVVALERLGPEAILWSWNDTKKDKHSPPVECCGSDCEPAWEVYAVSRGGNLKVTVNGGDYEFIFGPPVT